MATRAYQNLISLRNQHKTMLQAFVIVVDQYPPKFSLRAWRFEHMGGKGMAAGQLAGKPKCEGRCSWIFSAHMFKAGDGRGGIAGLPGFIHRTCLASGKKKAGDDCPHSRHLAADRSFRRAAGADPGNQGNRSTDSGSSLCRVVSASSRASAFSF